MTSENADPTFSYIYMAKHTIHTCTLRSPVPFVSTLKASIFSTECGLAPPWTPPPSPSTTTSSASSSSTFFALFPHVAFVCRSFQSSWTTPSGVALVLHVKPDVVLVQILLRCYSCRSNAGWPDTCMRERNLKKNEILLSNLPFKTSYKYYHKNLRPWNMIPPYQGFLYAYTVCVFTCSDTQYTPSNAL